MKQLSVLLLILTFPIQIAGANLMKQLDITGDEIVFDKNTQRVSANSNVVLRYHDYITHTDSFLYDPVQGLLQMASPFTLYQGPNTVNGQSLFYEFKHYTGTITTLNAMIGRYHISGKKVVFDSELISFKKAHLTTCDLPENKHYQVRSNTINLYSAWGFLVTFGNQVDVRGLPFSVPIPTFVYGGKQYGIISSSTLIPDVGSNQTEGFYIKEKIGYFISKKASGTFDFGTTQKLGWFLGFTQGYHPTTQDSFRLRYHRIAHAGNEGHFQYKHWFDQDQEQESLSVLDEFFDKFGADSNQEGSHFTALYQHRELINDRRVSFEPMVLMKVNRYQLPFSGWRISGHLSAADVTEEQLDVVPDKVTIYESKHLGNETLLSKTFVLTPRLHMDWDTFFYGNWYSSKQTWQRLFSRFRFKLQETLFNPEISYTKRLMPIVGGTPFEFEQRYSIETDEIGLSLSQENDVYFMTFNAAYSLEKHDKSLNDRLRTLDILVGKTFHCWRTGIRWKIQEQAIGFEVSVF